MKHWAGAGKFFASFGLLVLLSVAMGFGGMAELGRGGDTAGGGKKVKITVNPPFFVNTKVGETPNEVLVNLAGVINAGGKYKATVAGRVITVLRKVGKNKLVDVDIQLESDDRGFRRGKTLGAGTGVHRVTFVLEPGGIAAGGSTATVTVDELHVATVDLTAGMDGGAILTALKNELLIVLPGTYTVRLAGNKIQIVGANNVDWEDTDADLESFGVQSLGPPFDIPTLSGWGMAFLLLLLATAGWIVMRRRARPAGA